MLFDDSIVDSGYSSHVRDNWPEAYSLFCGGNPVTKPGHLAEIGSWVYAQFLGSERRGSVPSPSIRIPWLPLVTGCFRNMSTTSHVAEQRGPWQRLGGVFTPPRFTVRSPPMLLLHGTAAAGTNVPCGFCFLWEWHICTQDLC